MPVDKAHRVVKEKTLRRIITAQLLAAAECANGLVPGLFPHEDMTADITGNLDRTSEKDACQPALRVGRLRELGWAATFLASPYARFISGHTLVVDGANWLRRDFVMPEFVPVRQQIGKAIGPRDP